MTDTTADTAAVPQSAASDTDRTRTPIPDNAEWLNVTQAAFLVGRTSRSIRRWCESGAIVGRKSESGDWFVRADSLPTNGRKPSPSITEPQRNPDAMLGRLTDQLAALSMQCGYLKGQLETQTLRLTEGENATVRAKDEAETAKRKLARARQRLAKVSSIAARFVFGREDAA